MLLRKYKINWLLAAVIVAIAAILYNWESNNLKIETDILESMPKGDPVLSDAIRIIKHLPVQDRLIIDITRESANQDELAKAASVVADKLKASGLFTKVGITDEAEHFPDLMAQVFDNLPLLFNAERLEKKIKPLLESNRVKESFAQNRRSLDQLEGIGRSALMTKDPLGFSGIIFREMSALLPAGKTKFYKGQLISEDGKHALIIAKISGSGTDTVTAARISALLNDIEKGLPFLVGSKDAKYILHAAGAYRAALDNETAAKRDTRLAIVLTIVGIAILLLLAFPRPLIGLMALLPSTVGAIAALFVCSFFFKSMSLLAVGFGGAIMAFTIDLGVTYLLFLDQPQQTYGRHVARELWSTELLAVLSTIGAFLLLLISDFRILAEIGVFSALGVTFALLFVHFVFPRIFPSMPAAKRPGNPLILNVLKKIAAPARWKLIGAVIFGVVMLLFAKPVFNIDLNTMNSVSQETIAAENSIQKTWGDLSGKCYVFYRPPALFSCSRKTIS